MRCAVFFLLLLAPGTTGCGNGGDTPDAAVPDQGEQPDASKPIADLATPPDASKAIADLAVPPDDLPTNAARCREAADCPVAGNQMDPVYFQCVAVELFVNDWLWSCVPQSKCKGDPDCAVYGVNYICAYCGGANGDGCVRGCNVTADCFPGMTCDPTHRCRPRPCAVNGDCPAFDECGGDAGCDRRPCTADADCPGGYCIADPFQPFSHHCSVLPGICGY